MKITEVFDEMTVLAIVGIIGMVFLIFSGNVEVSKLTILSIMAFLLVPIIDIIYYKTSPEN